MPLDAIDEDTITEDQQPQAESEFAEARQKSRLQQMVAQKKKQLQEVAKTVIKKQVKSAVWKVILEILAFLFGNPYALIIWAAIALIVLGYACAEDVIECAQVVGLDGLIDAIGGVS